MKNEITNEFLGSRIRLAREEADLSQSELADILGYESPTAVSLMESGERKIKVEDLQAVSNITHRSMDFLMGKEEKMSNVKMALRADKDLSNKDKEMLMHFVDLAKKRNAK